VGGVLWIPGAAESNGVRSPAIAFFCLSLESGRAKSQEEGEESAILSHLSWEEKDAEKGPLCFKFSL